MKFIAGLLTVAALALSAPVHAEDYPSRPIKIIVPVAPGGITDVVARVFGDYLAHKTGQPVIVENRTGGAGTIGADALAKSAPDGYTLGLNSTSQIILNPLLQKNLSIDPLTELTPVAPIALAPELLIITAKLPVTNIAEFITYAKNNPGKLNYVSLGPGSTLHLGADHFAREAGIDIVPVQYRGTSPGITDLVAGNVQILSVGLAPVYSLIQAGSLRALVTTTAKRLPLLPDVPTSAEAGLPGYQGATWFALFAPGKTPRTIVEQLNSYAREMLADPEAAKRLTDVYIDPFSMKVDEFAAFVKSDAQRWARIVAESGLKPR